MRSHLPTVALALSIAACSPPAPPPSTPPPEVITGSSAVRPTSAMLDPFVGSYSGGGEALTVRRAGDGLIVERSSQPPLTLSLVGLGTFSDAVGNTYLFTGPSGARLTLVGANGSRRDFVR